jgi:hypothetical protein
MAFVAVSWQKCLIFQKRLTEIEAMIADGIALKASYGAQFFIMIPRFAEISLVLAYDFLCFFSSTHMM